MKLPPRHRMTGRFMKPTMRMNPMRSTEDRDERMCLGAAAKIANLKRYGGSVAEIARERAAMMRIRARYGGRWPNGCDDPMLREAMR